MNPRLCAFYAQITGRDRLLHLPVCHRNGSAHSRITDLHVSRVTGQSKIALAACFARAVSADALSKKSEGARDAGGPTDPRAQVPRGAWAGRTISAEMPSGRRSFRKS